MTRPPGYPDPQQLGGQSKMSLLLAVLVLEAFWDHVSIVQKSSNVQPYNFDNVEYRVRIPHTT